MICLIFFWKFFFKGLTPIPSDVVAGMYYPWLDYKWGYEVGVPVKNPILSDTVSQFWPWRNWAVENLKSGKISIWNPYALGGYPLSPWFHSVIFSPANILYFLFNQLTAMSLIIILQLLLMLCFDFLFLNELLKNKTAAIFGSISFAFSAFFIGWLTWATVGWVLAFLPLMLFFAKRIIEGERGLFFWGLYLSTLFSLLGGHPQTFMYSTLVFVIFSLYCGLLKNKKSLRALFLIFLLSIFSASFVLLPSLEILNHSIRGSENYLRAVDFGFLPFYKIIILLFAPNFFGSPASYNYWGGGFNFQEYLCWFGNASLVLMVFGFFNWLLKKKKSKEVKTAFVLLFFLGIIFTLKYPIGFLIYFLKIPLLSAASAARSMMMTAFAGSVLAAYGLKEFVGQEQKPVVLRKVFAVFLGISLGFVFGLGISLLTFKKLIFPGDEIFVPHFLANAKVALRNLVLPIGFAGLSGVILLWRCLKKPLAMVLIIAALLEGFYFGWKYTPFTKKDLYFPKTPVISFLEDKYKEGFFRIERQKGEIMPPNMWLAYGFYSMAGYDPVYPQAYADYLKERGLGGDASRYVEWESDKDSFDDWGVKYLLVIKRNVLGVSDEEGEVPFWTDLNKWKTAFEDKTVVVLENQRFRPPFFLLDGQGTLELLAKDESLWQFEVESPEKTTLVLRENYFPGWKAKIDGQAVEVKTFEKTFKAIDVDKGVHKILFHYENQWLKIGSIISLISLLIFLKIVFKPIKG